MSPWSRSRTRFMFPAAITILITFVASTENPRVLSVCGPSTKDDSAPSLAFISTLDGKISALDIGDKGEIKWTLDFGEGPLLSSNIHRRELNNDGHWVRLIPSLNGGLYKFDGDNLEPMLVSAEQLLCSSFRYSENLVFSGGKETRSYGVSSLTGKILYQCNITGCSNKTQGDSLNEEDILVVQRFQQTVRAVEPRSGQEKWNFSVGQHDLVLAPQDNINCKETASKIARDIELRVIVPEGLVWAVNKSNPRVKLWEQKFDSPVVSIWRNDLGTKEDAKSLHEMDLFEGRQWSWGSEFSTSPGIYVGMHDRQLYVQENTDLSRIMDHSHHKTPGFVKFPWRPFPARDTAVAIVETNAEVSTVDEGSNEIVEAPSTTALSVLYNSEYINGNGFYLYTKEQYESGSQCNGSDPNIITLDNTSETSDEYQNFEETPVQVMIVSLWYWWKEVVIISITTAILLNCMLAHRFINERVPTAEAEFPPVIVETHVEIKPEPSFITDGENALDFKSRYCTDFEHIDCLGKGGYGVVFEAKNKIDDCNYAIKRIALPKSRGSRDRVMREVKALAKLEHQNIVRYFNAWLECPPVDWQETQDEIYLMNRLSPSEFPSEYTESATKPSSSVCIDVSPCNNLSINSAIEAIELNNRPPDDSFIVFEASGTDGESECTEAVESFSQDDSSDDLNSCKNSPNHTNSCNYVHDVTRDSESVLFLNSDEDTGEKKNSSKSKESLSQRKASFSLNLNEKSTMKKSAKMFLYIQMQLCQKLSLREWLKRQPQMRDNFRIVNIFQQIVDAVEYVHLQGLIHRDLKPSNIFFAYDDKVKVGDFGLVTAMTEGLEDGLRTPDGEREPTRVRKNGHHTACVGTHLYMSPEQMNGQIYNYKVDIYSLGIILFELLIPFFTEMERIDALMNLRKSVFPNGFAEQHPDEYNLLKLMLDKNPSNRPTTLGIKARPPLSNCGDDLESGEINKWHFELPQLSRHSSVTNSSTSGESWDKLETPR